MLSLFGTRFIWLVVKDGDLRVKDIYMRHYSAHHYADNRRSSPGYRNRNLVMGPGEKMVLLSADGRAIFGWRKFIDDSDYGGGVNCAFFRNEGAFDGRLLSSELILEAEKLAWKRWPGERLYTYVSGKDVGGDGYCFKAAGWRKMRGRSGSGLIVLEKLAFETPPR